ncbi:hypothetical protein FH972_023428 [Carpinus fangiana]|uniref:2-(3-amino-3-carboxypropyl)histidine synthase subunit 2 n=1 Tax=Carpinus fangiana TaxID=176857 RepID=A0A5N6KV60_9ROSI|nr:hypothetical protein FH972_023428 [Carpinus fangiana]
MDDGTAPAAPPVLSTPDNHIFEQPGLAVDFSGLPRQDDEQLKITYEIQRTIAEIREGRRKRIALQFPDHMLPDSPRVFQALSRGLRAARRGPSPASKVAADNGLGEKMVELRVTERNEEDPEERLFVLADTSYGACCVDEVAAEHANADVVVHYGRSCLTPTARLPVIYVFTTPSLDVEAVVEAFSAQYSNLEEKIVLMADIPYNHHLTPLAAKLKAKGYSSLFVATLIKDPASPLPNRSVPTDGDALRQWQLFHISDPTQALLLTLSSRVDSVHIYPTNSRDPVVNASSTAMALNRRYAILTKLTTVPIFGILINTLSVKNYMDILAHVKKRIAEAGKKSYTFVVGKVNAAKVANFSEVGGWVVIGCWESSLLESKDFWKPVITPFELELALASDAERVWTGQWSSDFQSILEQARSETRYISEEVQNGNEVNDDDDDDDDESEPPEFDLRTGQYVSHSRPMKQKQMSAGKSQNGSTSLTRRANGDVATIGGVASPAAEYLKEKRTWQGLGSDFESRYEADGSMAEVKGAVIEAGRRGIAKGYTVGGSEAQH